MYIDEHTFMLLNKAMMHPHIEYAKYVWRPFKLGNIRD